jgi:bacteriophage HK97-gp10 putative tail-component
MDFEALLAQLAAQLPQKLRQAGQEVGDDLLSDSRDEIPYDQGDLSRSGKVTVEATGSNVEVAVSYDTPYAVIQHEATDFAHQDGRKAHYLGDPARENSRKYLEHIERVVLEG